MAVVGQLTVGAAVGLAAGLAFFATLAPVSRLLLRPHGAALAVPLQLARMLGLAALLTGLARLGTAWLLAGLAGTLAARALVLRRARQNGAVDG
jgi:hypothetical protein